MPPRTAWGGANNTGGNNDAWHNGNSSSAWGNHQPNYSDNLLHSPGAWAPPTNSYSTAGAASSSSTHPPQAQTGHSSAKGANHNTPHLKSADKFLVAHNQAPFRFLIRESILDGTDTRIDAATLEKGLQSIKSTARGSPDCLPDWSIVFGVEELEAAPAVE